MLGQELLDQIEIAVQGDVLDVRISGIRQNLLLDEEGGAADAQGDLGAIRQTVVGDDVQGVFAVNLFDQAGLLGLDVRPQPGVFSGLM